MFKILKLCLFLVLFSALEAEPPLDLHQYQLYVTDVEPDAHRFVLSNKMVFQIAKNNWNTDRLPHIGMEVRIVPIARNVESFSAEEAGEFQTVYFLYPQKRVINVWMPEESKTYCLSYVSTESICIQPAGWFSSAVYQDVAVLSDGSRWVAEAEGQIPFNKGERLLICQIDDVRWGIVDLDQIVLLEGSDGKKYERFLGIIVRPFVQESQSAK